jgi:NAD(P)-dependent dehydrogenase (short-subunit alcohol dehydrogenase family)
MRLAGKVAVVTGVTSEIGRAIAIRLAAEGAAVAATGNTPAKVVAAAADLQKAGGKFHIVATDLSSPEAVERFFADVMRTLGPTDILVNGAAWRARQSFLDTAYADWRHTFAVCVDSYFLCGLAAARQMIPRKWGRIIHVGSIAGSVLMAPYAAYTVAKGAVHALAKSMAVDLAPLGITVNVVAPGVVETQFVRTNLTPELIQKRLERIPMERMASPDDVAAAVAHLASPDMGYVTGQTLYVDGGFLSAGAIVRQDDAARQSA